MANVSTHNAIYLYLDGSRFDNNQLQDINFNTDRLTANSILGNSTVSSFMRSYGPSDYEFEAGQCVTYGDNNGMYQTFSPSDTIWPTQEEGVFWWVTIELVTPSTEITAYLEFNSNGGTPVSYSTISVTGESTTGYLYTYIPNNYHPTKDGYEFLGWKVTDYGSQFKWPGDRVDIQGSINGYTSYAVAQWEREQIKIQLKTTATSDSITATVINSSDMPSDFDHYFWQIDDTDGGTDTTGTYTFTGLTKGTTYTIKCGGYTSANEAIAYGTIIATTTSSNVWIYTGVSTNNGWQLATPYIYTGSQNGWKEAQAYIYTGSSGGWQPC